MSKNKGKGKGHSVETEQTASVVPSVEQTQSSSETQQDASSSAQDAPQDTNAAPSSETTQKTQKRPARPVVALTDAQTQGVYDVISALYGRFQSAQDAAGTLPLLTTADIRPALRVLRVTYKGKTPSVSRSGKTDEQRKSERTAYRFARRYAKKHGISIDAAREMYAKGKIAPSVRVTVDASNADSLDAQIARLMEARKRLAETNIDAARAGDDVPSAPDALALAAAIDAAQQ